jgi:hypothetical protein
LFFPNVFFSIILANFTSLSKEERIQILCLIEIKVNTGRVPKRHQAFRAKPTPKSGGFLLNHELWHSQFFKQNAAKEIKIPFKEHVNFLVDRIILNRKVLTLT